MFDDAGKRADRELLVVLETLVSVFIGSCTDIHRAGMMCNKVSQLDVADCLTDSKELGSRTNSTAARGCSRESCTRPGAAMGMLNFVRP